MKKSLRFSGGLAAIASVIGISALAATAASAETISAELVVDGSDIALANQSSTPGVFVFNSSGTIGASGSYTLSVDATGSPPLSGNSLLDTNTLDLQTDGLPVGTTLALLITESGLTNPPPGFESSFGVLDLTGGSYVGNTLYSATNQTFGGSNIGTTGAPITGPLAANIIVDSANPLAATPYSITADYTGTTTSTSGTFNANIDISATPLPATLPLLAGGLGMLGLLGRRKRQKANIA